ncbi:MAG: nicotinate (nicotinamide) nucleotide adenylyltransferase [archaeon]|nr:nicotinate (nicotinamide) nucleotide adenylyltransferase [archaeon]
MKQKTKKIGIFGGSFNPIHNYHIKIIKNLLNYNIVDEVWILPCKKHPLNKEIINEKYRVKMIKLAIKNVKDVKICDIELKSKGKNYTIKTIKKLKRKYGVKYHFFLVIGSDILYEIKKWNEYQKLFNEIGFIVFKRKGYPTKKTKGMNIYHTMKKEFGNVSSTRIRQNIKDGKSFKRLVPIKVEKYIIKEKLYQ